MIVLAAAFAILLAVELLGVGFAVIDFLPFPEQLYLEVHQLLYPGEEEEEGRRRTRATTAALVAPADPIWTSTTVTLDPGGTR